MNVEEGARGKMGKWEVGRLVMARAIAPTNPQLFQTFPNFTRFGGCT